ncbi:hypothetical protein [Flavobacterium psychrophilum]|uniref:hypothetical protein n=1 Tax=Flavobacterium psychrophilum TaxID=96345 RepID=UPI001D08E07A|nr:hypothetical protein [Flavobacterium psychrophilum]MCB6096007.1 hypothetical protein [Flavobacterium psychrophilum]
MKFIKLVLTISIISFSLTLNAQINDSLFKKTFENKKFKTNQIIGLKDFKYNPNISDIELQEPNDNYPYGNITTFENGKFTSGNIGFCGNECRITVSGNYYIKRNKIYLFLQTISFWKDCKNRPTENINKEIGKFTWKKDKNGKIKLTAVK